eukprot:GHVU01226877.1.p2 GENE.GHVU01226877.1~~GHVU01226877.1.p2  ORF type:complete len:146 (+),score=18.60 GHVU01226877.1:851-1288(+)
MTFQDRSQGKARTRMKRGRLRKSKLFEERTAQNDACEQGSGRRRGQEGAVGGEKTRIDATTKQSYIQIAKAHIRMEQSLTEAEEVAGDHGCQSNRGVKHREETHYRAAAQWGDVFGLGGIEMMYTIMLESVATTLGCWKRTPRFE